MRTRVFARAALHDAPSCRRAVRAFSAAATLALLLAVVALSSPAQALLAGAATASIETPVGAPLGGYGGLSERRSTGTLDLPEARALVLDDGAVRLALVSLDIVIVRPALRDAIVSYGASLDIPHVVVVATHTHSGTGGYLEGLLPSRLAGGGRDAQARARIVRAAEDALARAAGSLAPTHIGVGRGRCDLAHNRRREDGPREHDLPVIRFVRDDGTPLALLFAYGVHGVMLGPANHSASADLIGVARRTLDARFGTSLFLPGPLGDQNPFAGGHGGWPEEIDAQVANRDAAGARLASAVAAAADAIAPERDARLAVARHEAPVPSLDLADRSLLWWFSPVLGDVLAHCFSRQAAFYAVDIGAARLLSVPAEPSSTLGDALRRAAGPDRVPIAVAHADDWLGYALTAEDYETGGYEAGMSFFGRGFGPWLVEQSGRAAHLLDTKKP